MKSFSSYICLRKNLSDNRPNKGCEMRVRGFNRSGSGASVVAVVVAGASGSCCPHVRTDRTTTLT